MLLQFEVRTLRGALVVSLKRYLASLDLILKDYPPTRYAITIRPLED